MNLKPGIHLLTFGGGSSQFRAAARRLARQAATSAFFSTIAVVTDLDLQNDEAFQGEHGRFVANNPRGFGYWVWKPYLLLRALEKAKDGDIVFYCDGGCEFNPLGGRIFARYVEHIQRTGLLLFRLPYLNECWTKGDLLMRYPALIGQGQIMATVVGIRADDAGRAFLRTWYDLCRGDGYRYLDDTPSVSSNHPSLVEHRHDQSCLSAAALEFSAAAILSDNPDFIKGSRMIDQPILIRRNKTGLPSTYAGSLLGFSFLIYFKRRFPRIIVARQR